MKNKLTIILVILITALSACDNNTQVRFGNIKKPFVIIGIEKVNDNENVYISKDSIGNNGVNEYIQAPTGFNIGDTLIVIKKPTINIFPVKKK